MNQDQVTEFLKDLEYIKSAVGRNQPLLREISEATLYRGLVLGIGIAATAIPLAYQWLISRYGSLNVVPHGVQVALVSIVVASGVGAMLGKWISLRMRVAGVDRRLTVGSLFRGFFLLYVYHIYLPVMLLGISLSVCLALSGHGYYVIGAAGVTIGLLMNSLGVLVQKAEYYVMGYWLLLSGFLSLSFPGLGGGVWAAVGYGGSCLAFFVAGEFLALRSGSREAGEP